MQRFVVGTGRCGSTLMSNQLASHSHVLSLSEYMVSFAKVALPTSGEIDGHAFASILSRYDGLGALFMNRDFNVKEILTDLGPKGVGPVKRFPTITLAAMPFLSDDPAALFADFLAQARSQPLQTLRAHFLQINQWLQDRFGKSLWIERSGISSNFMGVLVDLFPDAKFLHIYRDGPECALSMSKHVDLIIKTSYHYDPPSDEELLRSTNLSLPRHEDPYYRRVDNPPSIEQFGHYWSYCLAKLYAHVSRLRPEQLLTVGYEALLADPRAVLEQVADFYEMPDDPGWMDRAAAKIVRRERPHVDDLPAADRAALERACEFGRTLLALPMPPAPEVASALKLEAMIDNQWEAQA